MRNSEIATAQAIAKGVLTREERRLQEAAELDRGFAAYISGLIARGETGEARRVLCRALNQRCRPDSPFVEDIPVEDEHFHDQTTRL